VGSRWWTIATSAAEKPSPGRCVLRALHVLSRRFDHLGRDVTGDEGPNADAERVRQCVGRLTVARRPGESSADAVKCTALVPCCWSHGPLAASHSSFSSPSLTVPALVGVLAGLLSFTHPGVARAGGEAEAEAAIVVATRNDVRIPGDTGSSLSLVDDLSTSAAPAFRVRVGARIAERHLITALYAPLSLSARGVLDRDIDFAGSTFPAGSSVYALYRFDSYRLTYRYSFIRDEVFELAGGLTGKNRGVPKTSCSR
jgi:hypothetical protein